MRSSLRPFALALFVVFGVLVLVVLSGRAGAEGRRTPSRAGGTAQHALRLIHEGRQTFRHDTFGDEAFWGDALHLHQAVVGAELGGVGPGVSPKAALEVGLKVDMDALPHALQSESSRQVNLDDPATTLALLKLDAVVGVKGSSERTRQLRSVGIQCALCHSTVDDSFAPGIGHRLDGWPNRDLNVGAIIALAPDLKPIDRPARRDEATVQKVLRAGGRASSTPSCSSTARRSARTASRPPR